MRRSRNGWRWIDRVDAPLGEEREAYRVLLRQSDGTVRTVMTEAPTIVVARADRADGAAVHVSQIGAMGDSEEATLSLPAWNQ